MRKPTSKAPCKVADVLKPSHTDAVGQHVHARRYGKSKVFIQLHALELLHARLSTPSTGIRSDTVPHEEQGRMSAFLSLPHYKLLGGCSSGWRG